MGLLNDLIVILAIKILLLKVTMWRVNAIPVDHPSFEFPNFGIQVALEKNDSGVETFESNCNEVISRKISQYIPYTETYRYRQIFRFNPLSDDSSVSWTPFYETRNRLNYRRRVIKLINNMCNNIQRRNEKTRERTIFNKLAS